MSEKSIQQGLYTITAEGQTSFYCTENFGKPGEVLALLWSVRTAGDRTPTLRGSEAERLTGYSKNLLPISLNKRQRLFQPLEPEEYSFLQAELQGGDSTFAHYILDYDQNRFAAAAWDGSALKKVSASLGDMIDAYNKAARRTIKGNYTVNQKVLLSAVEKIVTVEVILDRSMESGSAQDIAPEDSGMGPLM